MPDEATLAPSKGHFVAISSRAALMASILILFTGCGSSNSAQDSTGSTKDTETGTSEQEKPAEPFYRILGKRGLSKALLGVQDLPAGYSQDPPTDEGRNKTFCDYKPPFNEKVKVSRDFTKGGGLSAELLRVGLRQYANTQQAKVAFDALAKALETCKQETYNGTKMSYAPMSAPKVGDAAVGVKITGDDISLPQYFALVGPTLVNTGGGGLMNANADEISDLLRDQVKAYKAAAIK